MTNGFDRLDKTITKGLEELFNVGAGTNQTLIHVGRIMSGAVVGAGIGGATAGLMGGDAGIGSIGGAVGGALGKGAASLFSIGATTALGIALPIVGSVIGSLLGGLLSRKKDTISRSVVTAEGETTRTQTNKLSAGVSEDVAKQFWQGATAQADKYGVEFASGLASMVTYKTHRKGKGPMMWYFDLFKDSDKNGERDGEKLYYTNSFKADDKSPEQIALAMAQMQVAALATADWSKVSEVIAHGMTGISPNKMSMQDIGQFKGWLDQTILIEKAFGDMLGNFKQTLTGFGGSFKEFLSYTTSVYSLVTRHGKGMVDDLMTHFHNNTADNWAEVAASLNAVTHGMHLLGQTTEAHNLRLIHYSKRVTKALGGVEAAMKTYQAIFNATATETHKAGVAYQAAREQLNMLNASMGLTGDKAILSTEQLRQWVAALDPTTERYAEQIRFAGQMAVTLTASANASKYFNDAIAGIKATISGVIKGIREDMMSAKELYDSRKKQAEQQAASIAKMTDVAKIKSAAEEVTRTVSQMWRSLSEEQRKAGVGDWMVKFIEEMNTLAKGRIEELQNKYKAEKKPDGNYEETKTAATEMLAVAESQKQASASMAKSADNIRAMTGMIQKAAATMSAAAEKINKPIDVDVTVQQVAVGGEIN